jgi:hypothetical protein
MHKNATKCNETLGKWYKNKHGASKIMDTLETYHRPTKQQNFGLGWEKSEMGRSTKHALQVCVQLDYVLSLKYVVQPAIQQCASSADVVQVDAMARCQHVETIFYRAICAL